MPKKPSKPDRSSKGKKPPPAAGVPVPPSFHRTEGEKSPDAPSLAAPPVTFDPSRLNRTIIALPLLDKIRREQESVAYIKALYPEVLPRYNSVVILPADRPVDDLAVRQTLMDLLTGVPLRGDSRAPRLGPKLDKISGLFAWIDARTIQRVLARQDALRVRGREAELPLLVESILPSRFRVIIDLNLEFVAGREAAQTWVEKAVGAILGDERIGIDDPGQGVEVEKSRLTDQYVFALLEARAIARLVEIDAEPVTAEKGVGMGAEIKAEVVREFVAKLPPEERRRIELAKDDPDRLRAIHRIWPDFDVKTRITESISTVKANAAINAFAARGENITWAVMDTGIQGDHPHFQQCGNINAASPLHRDFTQDVASPLIDENGHGTHVAGIIAGEWKAERDQDRKEMKAAARSLDQRQADDGRGTQSRGGDALDEKLEFIPIQRISGMAPDCQLVSLKVLDENGIGSTSNIIAAIAYVQKINGYGRHLLIHGVNISAGYPFDPKWFACGQSPLCVEVNRLVKSGVVVVVAAGNTGYGSIDNGNSTAGLGVTINDPGNAECAITVGSTHRNMPHVYGVSYFSSKGPTGDGRPNPDLVAPGERIISCASTKPPVRPDGPRLPSELKRDVAGGMPCEYLETSGTSMAAPHVSGLAAAFLSVRREFIGQPERLKEIFVTTCTDLRRDRSFQGAGLIDLMRAIQSV